MDNSACISIMYINLYLVIPKQPSARVRLKFFLSNTFFFYVWASTMNNIQYNFDRML